MSAQLQPKLSRRRYAKWNMLCEIEKSSDVCRTASLSEMGHEQRAATSSTVTDQRRKNFFVRKSSVEGIWELKPVHLVQSSGPVSTVPGYVVYNQTRDVSGQSLFSWPTCMLAFSTSLSAPIRQQPVHLTWVGQGTPVMWFSQLP